MSNRGDIAALFAAEYTLLGEGVRDHFKAYLEVGAYGSAATEFQEALRLCVLNQDVNDHARVIAMQLVVPVLVKRKAFYLVMQLLQKCMRDDCATLVYTALTLTDKHFLDFPGGPEKTRLLENVCVLRESPINRLADLASKIKASVVEWGKAAEIKVQNAFQLLAERSAQQNLGKEMDTAILLAVSKLVSGVTAGAESIEGLCNSVQDLRGQMNDLVFPAVEDARSRLALAEKSVSALSEIVFSHGCAIKHVDLSIEVQLLQKQVDRLLRRGLLRWVGKALWKVITFPVWYFKAMFVSTDKTGM